MQITAGKVKTIAAKRNRREDYLMIIRSEVAPSPSPKGIGSRRRIARRIVFAAKRLWCGLERT